MERRSVEAIVRALRDADVRYLIAGGLAVVAHGYVRLTVDFDVLLDLAPDNARRALDAFAGLSYRPRAPVPLADFADPAKRSAWIREKDLTVFSMASPLHPATEIDVFMECPFDFEAAFGRARRLEVAPGLEAPFVSFEDLLALKRLAGRPKDLEDIRRLQEIREGKADA